VTIRQSTTRLERCQRGLWLALLTGPLGCPQALDDPFRIGAGARGGSGGAVWSPPVDGGSGGATAGAAGTVTDAGAGGAGGAGDLLDAGPGDVDAGRPGCPSPSRGGPDGACHVWVEATLTWSEARASCRARGAGWDLLAIRSASMSEFLDAWVTAETWAGASDASAEGSWEWVANGAAFWLEADAGQPVSGAYANWNSDEPNGGDPSDCMRILSTAKWADLECSARRAHLCAGPPPER
jgi:hypothetical protein